MGDVVTLASLRRARPDRFGAGTCRGPAEIAFFTGVRIERWSSAACERAADRLDDPAVPDPQPPRGRRRRRSGP